MRPARRGPVGPVSSALGIVLVVLGSLGGCGLFSKADPTVERADPTAEAGVTLLDAGAEPHRLLRYAFASGDTVDLDLALGLHITQTSPGQERPQVVDPPVTVQTMRVTVESVDDDGATISFEVVDARLDPDDTDLTELQIEQLTTDIRKAIGLRGTIRVDPLGYVTSLDYEDLAGLDASSARTTFGSDLHLSSLISPLPTEPVGRGARWRSVTRDRTAGMTLRQVTEYEVTALDGDRITFRATVHQSAPEQVLEDRNGWRVLAAELTGTTSGMLSTTRLVTESETTLGGTQLLELDDTRNASDRGPVEVTQTLDLTVAVTPVAPAGA